MDTIPTFYITNNSRIELCRQFCRQLETPRYAGIKMKGLNLLTPFFYLCNTRDVVHDIDGQNY